MPASGTASRARSRAARRADAGVALSNDVRERRVGEDPATGSGSSACTAPSEATTMPLPSSTIRSTATRMLSSSIPTTTTLWASCERLDASAPCRSRSPWSGRGRSAPYRGAARARQSSPGRARPRRRPRRRRAPARRNAWVTIWPGTIPITRAVRPRPRPRRSGRRSASGANRPCGAPSRAPPAAGSRPPGVLP